MPKPSYDSREYRAYGAEVRATGPTCWWCGHPGSDEVDHLLPQSTHPHLAGIRANWIPIHGTRGCPWCPPNPSRDRRRRGKPTRCNQARGNRLTRPQHHTPSRPW